MESIHSHIIQSTVIQKQTGAIPSLIQVHAHKTNMAIASYDEMLEIEVAPPRHLTKKDIITPFMAIKSCKSTKLHKMKPRTEKRDRTKTSEKKEMTKNRRFDRESRAISIV